MATTDEPENQSKRQASSEPDQVDLASLRREMAEFKQQIEKAVAELNRRVEEGEVEKRGIIGWARRWGVVVGFVAALFAVPPGLIGLNQIWADMHSSCNTRVIADWPLTVSYDPENKQVQFSFNFTIAERGNRDNVIRRAEARLETVYNKEATSHPASSSQVEPADKKDPVSTLTASTLPIEITNLIFNENGTLRSTPFNVLRAAPREMTCSLTYELADLKPEEYQTPGVRHLVVELKDDNGKTYPLAFCFYLNDKLISMMFQSSTRQTRRFLEESPVCQAGKN